MKRTIDTPAQRRGIQAMLEGPHRCESKKTWDATWPLLILWLSLTGYLLYQLNISRANERALSQTIMELESKK